ncbi:hypothetical protein RJT34_30329 [Clitoria ternatea]|uniref:RING-type domain-containing protein n=1 Tax=Clitoria ternatea TaxID=43366 RepID=A0AAN9I2I9_CLITE
MGSNGSKATSSSCSSLSTTTTTSSSSGSFRKGKSKGFRVFHSCCLGTTSGSHDCDNEDPVCDNNKVNGSNVTSDSNVTSSEEVKTESFRKIKAGEISCVPSNIDLYGWNETSIPNSSSRTDSSPVHSCSSHSLNPTSHLLSRLSLIPGNVRSFRLSRAASLGSSRPCPVSSANLATFDNDEHNLCPVSSGNTEQCSDLLPVSFSNQIHAQCHEHASNDLRSNSPASGLLGNLQCITTGGVCTREGLDVDLFSWRIQTATENVDARHIDGQNGALEPVERNVRFSRSLSVGRLCDRVQERELRDASQDTGRPTVEEGSRVLPSDLSAVNSSSSMSNSETMVSIQDEVETSRFRESRYQDPMEHRSNNLERRRRMRSQVRAPQRLGSRFDNLSGHDRSCILSGQNRNGHCPCQINNHDTNSNDNTSSRVSITRIVMLAQALSEVLDEIHQQSVVLSSHSSASSVGSVPAPNDAVESLPIKLYEKMHKHQEDAAQCYICLVEYEDGDSMRVLPCHHEFHRACIDKWLKEIHRVCPLCRGDICISDSHN